MTSMNKKISNHTVENYLEALCKSYILYKANRYDVKGKQYLETNGKYYLVDIGLRYYLLGTKYVDFGHILENIVFLELLRRGYEVYIGNGITDVTVNVGSNVLRNSYAANDPRGFYQAVLSLTEADI